MQELSTRSTQGRRGRLRHLLSPESLVQSDLPRMIVPCATGQRSWPRRRSRPWLVKRTGSRSRLPRGDTGTCGRVAPSVAQGACVPDWCFPLAVQGPDRWLLSPSCLSSPVLPPQAAMRARHDGMKTLTPVSRQGNWAVRDKTQGAKLRLAAVILIYKVPSVKPSRSNHRLRPHAIQLRVRSGDMDVLPVGGKQYRFRYIELTRLNS